MEVGPDRRAREHGFPVIRILLPVLDEEPTGFLSLQTWTDFRVGLDDPEQLQTLIAAIHREASKDASAETRDRIRRMAVTLK